MPVEEKIKLEDYVIYNDSDFAALNKKVDVLYTWLLERSAV
jgi:dephospho-CoA kinase